MNVLAQAKCCLAIPCSNARGSLKHTSDSDRHDLARGKTGHPGSAYGYELMHLSFC